MADETDELADAGDAGESNEVRWALLAECATGMEADLLKSDLEAADIPVLIHGQQVGMFGSGFLGTVVGGVEVHVPSPELERAREIMQVNVKPD